MIVSEVRKIETEEKIMAAIYDFTLTSGMGEEVNLKDFE